ncbi:hypothetical protein DXZ20_05810 [Leptolyngbyaceae cyanobacterium CCMR0081]|uniref:Uncharacterized protein n=1 Tax=Adonisia turfae CCMR0081 TaxID=2292702 RepID=A0A6M0RGD5_9CYAN|nr:hypothetical protein [Adonisia turfae CCMR0081]
MADLDPSRLTATIHAESALANLVHICEWKLMSYGKPVNSSLLYLNFDSKIEQKYQQYFGKQYDGFCM